MQVNGGGFNTVQDNDVDPMVDRYARDIKIMQNADAPLMETEESEVYMPM